MVLFQNDLLHFFKTYTVKSSVFSKPAGRSRYLATISSISTSLSWFLGKVNHQSRAVLLFMPKMCAPSSTSFRLKPPVFVCLFDWLKLSLYQFLFQQRYERYDERKKRLREKICMSFEEERGKRMCWQWNEVMRLNSMISPQNCKQDQSYHSSFYRCHRHPKPGSLRLPSTCAAQRLTRCASNCATNWSLSHRWFWFCRSRRVGEHCNPPSPAPNPRASFYGSSRARRHAGLRPNIIITKKIR